MNSFSMKAIQIQAYGGSEVLEINENVSIPEPRNGQLFVDVRAASINPFDIMLVSGMLKEQIPFTFPATVGGDFSGVVVKTGQEVYGTALLLTGGSGAFAQKATVMQMNVAAKPSSIGFDQAAALPLVGSSAVQALEEHMKLTKGQKILIHGGAGGIGHIAIQLAKALGAFVATTVKTKDQEFVTGLGADEVIDYIKERFEEKIHDYDCVFDMVGGEVTAKSFVVLKKGGTLVSMVGLPDQDLARKYEVIAIGQVTKTNTQHLDRVRELVDSKKVSVHVDKFFPLEKVKQAWEHKASGHPQGKVVVDLQKS